MGRVVFGGGNTGERNRRGLSQALWLPMPWEKIKENPDLGSIKFIDFESLAGDAVASNAGMYNCDGAGFRTFEGTGGSMLISNTDNPNGPYTPGLGLGVLKMLTAATAHINNAIEFASGANVAGAGSYGVGGAAALTIPSGPTAPILIFEARIRFVQSTVQSAFLGMAVPNKTSGINTVFNGSDVYQNMNCIGFQINGAASTTVINSIYGVAASAPVNVSATGGVPSTAAYPGTNLVPAGLLTDFTKIGFCFNPLDPNQPLAFYQDGILLGFQTMQGITATKWPSNVPLNPLLYLQAQGAGGAAVELDVDWIAVGQGTAIE